MIGLAAVSVTAGAAASRPPCTREIVSGNLDGDVAFTAREVIVYADGVFPGNPLVARVAGEIAGPGWFSVRLPGLRAPDQLRVAGIGAEVGAYFVEDGRLLFYAALRPGSAAGTVSIFYIAGSATWSHHFELDFERSELALVARVDWPAKTMFRNVDLLLVSGKLHAASRDQYPALPAPASTAGASLWDFSDAASSAPTDTLAAFEVPSSTDAGIYVVHRARAVDIPGSNSHGMRECTPASFFLRVYESPVQATPIVAVNDSTLERVGQPLVIELRNQGDLPWMSGRADIYKDGILAGADTLPYVARNGTARIEMGTAFDVRVARSVETVNGTRFQNYTVRNLDVTPYDVEIEAAYSGIVGDPGIFVKEESKLTARLQVLPSSEVTVGWSGPA